MSKNIRIIIITLLICAAAAFSVNQITSTAAHDAQLNAQQQNQQVQYPYQPDTSLTQGWYVLCTPSGNTSVDVPTAVDIYFGPDVTAVSMPAKPTAAQVKAACS